MHMETATVKGICIVENLVYETIVVKARIAPTAVMGHGCTNI